MLAYLSGWTDQLHAEGYLSGVYSSASSGITDLVKVNGTGYSVPDDLWIAHWDGSATTSDSYVPSSDWANHQRIRQYQGDHRVTYGGVALDIDSDYVDGATADTGGAAPASVVPDGTFVQVTGSTEVYRIAGGAPLLVNDWTPFGGPQPVQQITQIEFDQLRSFPADGTFLSESATGPTYRVAGGSPISRQHLGHLRRSAAEHPDRPLGHPEHLESVRPPAAGAGGLHGRAGSSLRGLLAVRGRAAHRGAGNPRRGHGRRRGAGRIPGRGPVRRGGRRRAELCATAAPQGDSPVRGSAAEAHAPRAGARGPEEGQLPAWQGQAAAPLEPPPSPAGVRSVGRRRAASTHWASGSTSGCCDRGGRRGGPAPALRELACRLRAISVR